MARSCKSSEKRKILKYAGIKKKIETVNKSNSLEQITNIFINKKRKMIKKQMKQQYDDYIEVSNRLGIDLKLRPQNLKVKKYIEICKYYEDLT